MANGSTLLQREILFPDVSNLRFKFTMSEFRWDIWTRRNDPGIDGHYYNHLISNLKYLHIHVTFQNPLLVNYIPVNDETFHFPSLDTFTLSGTSCPADQLVTSMKAILKKITTANANLKCIRVLECSSGPSLDGMGSQLLDIIVGSPCFGYKLETLAFHCGMNHCDIYTLMNLINYDSLSPLKEISLKMSKTYSPVPFAKLEFNMDSIIKVEWISHYGPKSAISQMPCFPNAEQLNYVVSECDCREDEVEERSQFLMKFPKLKKATVEGFVCMDPRVTYRVSHTAPWQHYNHNQEQ